MAKKKKNQQPGKEQRRDPNDGTTNASSVFLGGSGPRSLEIERLEELMEQLYDFSQNSFNRVRLDPDNLKKRDVLLKQAINTSNGYLRVLHSREKLVSRMHEKE